MYSLVSYSSCYQISSYHAVDTKILNASKPFSYPIIIVKYCIKKASSWWAKQRKNDEKTWYGTKWMASNMCERRRKKMFFAYTSRIRTFTEEIYVKRKEKIFFSSFFCIIKSFTQVFYKQYKLITYHISF